MRHGLRRRWKDTWDGLCLECDPLGRGMLGPLRHGVRGGGGIGLTWVAVTIGTIARVAVAIAVVRVQGRIGHFDLPWAHRC